MLLEGQLNEGISERMDDQQTEHIKPIRHTLKEIKPLDVTTALDLELSHHAFRQGLVEQLATNHRNPQITHKLPQGNITSNLFESSDAHPCLLPQLFPRLLIPVSFLFILVNTDRYPP